jgi:hypothetical protein
MGEGSLSPFIHFYFSPRMPKNEKDYSPANNSSRTVTPDCESVTRQEKQYDFSEFNNFFIDVIRPCMFAEWVEEIQKTYLNLSLYLLMDYAGMEQQKPFPHADIQNHIWCLSELINLIKKL